jgi:hypothetical protein
MAMFSDSGVRPQEALLVLASSGDANLEYRILHVKAKDRIMQDGRIVPAEFVEASLDPEVFGLLEPVWRTMTAAARWPRRDEVLSIDPGRAALDPPAAFRFDYWGNHSFSQGTATSPRPGGCSAEFISIVGMLTRFADEQDSKKRGMLRGEMLRRIRAFSLRTESIDPDPCADGACHSR